MLGKPNYGSFAGDFIILGMANRTYDTKKHINSTTFGVGRNVPKKQKGQLAKKTIIRKQITEFVTSSISEYMETGGLEKLLTNIQKLRLKDSVNAHLELLEYYKPKLSRVEVKTDAQNTVINVFGQIPTQTVMPPKPQQQIEDNSNITPHIELFDGE